MAFDDSRNFRIDLLRGIAISLVLILHYHLSYALTDSPLALLFSKEAIRAVAVNGNYGVTMFFAISGYLITSTAVKRYGRLADVNLPRFYSEPVNAWLRAAFLRAPLPPAAVRP